MIDLINENIIKTGLCRYREKEYRVYICKSDFFMVPGTMKTNSQEKILKKSAFLCGMKIFCIRVK